jgi:ABC-type uncharacterized transport system fused permease/ATPase subunit
MHTPSPPQPHVTASAAVQPVLAMLESMSANMVTKKDFEDLRARLAQINREAQLSDRRAERWMLVWSAVGVAALMLVALTALAV